MGGPPPPLHVGGRQCPWVHSTLLQPTTQLFSDSFATPHNASRYQVNAQPAAERCWAQCRRFYQLAARVAPSVGSAYNQLAVLCSYEADDLGAAFFYIR